MPVFIFFARGYFINQRRAADSDQTEPSGSLIKASTDINIFHAAFAGAIGTCLTHPLLWFVWTEVIRYFFQGEVPHKYLYSIYVISGELIVATIESFTFYFAAMRKFSLSRAVAASFFANAASYGLGQLFRHFFPGAI